MVGKGLEILGPVVSTDKGLQATAGRADGISLADLSNLIRLMRRDSLIERDRCRLIASRLRMTHLVLTTMVVGRIAEAMEEHPQGVPRHHGTPHLRRHTIAHHRRRITTVEGALIRPIVIGMGGGSR